MSNRASSDSRKRDHTRAWIPEAWSVGAIFGDQHLWERPGKGGNEEEELNSEGERFLGLPQWEILGQGKKMHALDLQERFGGHRERKDRGFSGVTIQYKGRLWVKEISQKDFSKVLLHIKTVLSPLIFLKRLGKDLNHFHLYFSAWLLFFYTWLSASQDHKVPLFLHKHILSNPFSKASTGLCPWNVTNK